MHVFIPVFFNAPLGGLQSHVLAQVRALHAAGHRCTVMCRPGPFAATLRAHEVPVLETDFADVAAAARVALASGPYDLVHAHPYRSREVGLEVARQADLPFVLTLHGILLDGLRGYRDQVTTLLTVSPAIRDIAVADGFPAERALVFENGVDLARFRPHAVTFEALVAAVPAARDAAPPPGVPTVLLVSRFDADKQFIVDLVRETFAKVAEEGPHAHWLMVGDGTARPELEAAAAALRHPDGRPAVHFLGWQEEPALAELYAFADACIGPGRCALESLASGTPVAAVGSKGYVGLIDGDRFFDGLYGNFGGFGRKHQGYRPLALHADLVTMLADAGARRALGERSAAVARAYFDQALLDRRLLAIYGEALHARAPAASLTPLRRPEWAYADARGRLSKRWAAPRTGRSFAAEPAGDGLEVGVRLPAGEKVYVSTGGGAFDRPPGEPALWRLRPGADHAVELELETLEGAPGVELWIIRYDGASRLGHDSQTLRPGLNRLTFRSEPEAVVFRVALRFTGEGRVRLSRFTLFGPAQG